VTQADAIIQNLRLLANGKNVEGMARYGIRGGEMLGISMYTLRDLAKSIPKNHALALKLWDSGIHEARILASLVDEPAKVTEPQLEKWVADFDSWDIVDQVSALIAVTPFVLPKIHQWSVRDEEFVRRAAFSLIAEVSFYRKKMDDTEFEQFFPLIIGAATDERNFVKKAVNWALRNTGKRNQALNKRALDVARQIQKIDSKSAHWIAADAIRELESEAVQARLAKKSTKLQAPNSKQ
jgi:3-methyladenine DNA glycosylase AlkD